MSMMALLRQALAKCPDEVPSPSTTELVFIADADLRESIRRDISAANQDMVSAEWKGATVLAGSATEALLLWASDRRMLDPLRRQSMRLLLLGRLPKGPTQIPSDGLPK